MYNIIINVEYIKSCIASSRASEWTALTAGCLCGADCKMWKYCGDGGARQKVLGENISG